MMKRAACCFAALCLGLGAGQAYSQTAKHAEKPLYERLGGEPAVTAVVDGLLGRATKNPVIAKRFEGANVPRLRAKLIEQICAATGGPQKYTGLDMKVAHAGMGLTNREFNALVSDIKIVLNSAKVPAREQKELLTFLASTKKDIVASTKPRTTAQRLTDLERTVGRLEARLAMMAMAGPSAAAVPAAVTKVSPPKTPMFTKEELAFYPTLLARFTTATAKSAPLTEESRAFIGKPLPQTKFIGQDGSVVDLAELTGKKNAVVVFMRGFAGTVCLNCSTQLMALSQAKEKFDAADSTVFVIYPGDVATIPTFISAVSQLMADYKLPFQILLDADLSAIRLFNIEGSLAKPTTLVVDKKGIVRWAYVGQQPADRPAVSTVLEQVNGIK